MLGQVRSDTLEAESILLKAESGLLGLGQAGSGLQVAGLDIQEGDKASHSLAQPEPLRPPKGWPGPPKGWHVLPRGWLRPTRG